MFNPKPKIQFILKRREDIGQDPSYSQNGVSTGLLNSASFVVDMLKSNGFDVDLVVVTDNNCIDREVTRFKPDYCIIEALWVVPEKFDVLSKLHPSVKWIVRLHSETPFIACEGIALKWFFEYIKKPNVYVGINAPRFLYEMQELTKAAHLDCSKILYLPNAYPLEFHKKAFDKKKDMIDIGCFGAVRPLKNHLMQAHAAIVFADRIGKKLNFHINIGRTEMKGEPVLHNLIGLFQHQPNHQLVMHQWCPHNEFKQIVRSMDIGMQVSFSETFNIVTADLISEGVPIVVSKEVPWANNWICDPTSMKDILGGLYLAYKFPQISVAANVYGLKKFVRQTEKIWCNTF